MKKLAIVITHPIQYYAPVFKLLAEQCHVKVFYTWGEKAIKPKHDPGFGKAIAWDIPLLDGYKYEFLENTASNPGSHHRKGIINPDIVERISTFEPNALLFYGYAYESHFRAMRYFKGKIPVWFRGDSTLLNEDGWVKSILKSIYLQWVYSYVDKAFYVGSNNKEYFQKYGLKKHQLIFAPHAIDNERFSEDRSLEVKTLRNSLDLNQNDILILFAGKLEPKKNPEILLRAFLNLNRNNVHLLFVGNGVLEQTLKDVSISMANRIHFIDFQNQTQMPVIYQACDIFCLPSQGPGETWGLAVNEAMATGKAILASNKVGCSTDLVKSHENGFIFESGNIDDLSDKLNQLLESDLRQYGKKSKEIIKNWSFEKQVESFLQELKKC